VARDGCEWLASRPGYFILREIVLEPIEQETVWVPELVWKRWLRKKSLHLPGNNSGHPVRSLVTILTELSRFRTREVSYSKRIEDPCGETRSFS